jgi:hypothetical protein
MFLFFCRATRTEALVHALSSLLDESASSILKMSDEFRSNRTPVVVGRVAAETLQALVAQLRRRVTTVLQ